MLLPYFNPGAVATTEPMIRHIAEDLIERLMRQPTADLAADFAIPLPALVTCRLLGLPDEYWSDLVDWFVPTISGFTRRWTRSWTCFTVRSRIVEARKGPTSSRS